MPLHEALIAIKDEKGDISHLKFWIDPNGETLETCLSVVMSLAGGLVDDTRTLLITGQIVDVVLRVHGDLSTLTGNPPAPAVGADVQEKLVLIMETSGGHKMRVSVPTVDEGVLNLDGSPNFSVWEYWLQEISNHGPIHEGTSEPLITDARGEHALPDQAGYPIISFADWGKRRRR